MRTRNGFRGGLVAFVGAFATCLLAPGAAVAGTLDQQQTDMDGGGFAIHSTFSSAQTFTAGASGGIDQVDMALYEFAAPSAPLIVQIRDVSGGMPGGTALASQSVPASAVPAALAFVPVMFSPPAPVVAGTQYAIVAFSSTPLGSGYYVWRGSLTVDPYAAGSGFTTPSSPPTTPWNPILIPVEDFAFRTYVAPAPPPTSTPSTTSALTGQRAAALAKCKRKHDKKKRKRCRKRAKQLPL